MQTLLLFAVLGLGTGALIAGLAMGLVVTYRGSGIINLAMGAIAMASAYSFWAFKTGELGLKFSTPVSLVFTLGVTLALAVLMEVLAFRPLRAASPLAKVAASLGILLVLQATVLLAFGSGFEIEPTILPSGSVPFFGGVSVPSDHFILSGVAIAFAVGLSGVYRWTRFGLATRAASENETSAMMVGLSTNRLAMTNTLLASLTVGVMAVLVAPIIVLDTEALPLQIIPALAAALFANFTSIGVACAAGLAIGAGENLLYYASTQTWFPKDQGVPYPGAQQLLVFVLIVIAMFIRGSRLPIRGAIVERRLPAVPKAKRLLRPALIALVVVPVALIVLPYGFRQAAVNTEIAVVLMLSLVVIVGFVGQISVAQLALAGASGLVVSHLADSWGIGFPLGPLIGALVATMLGMIIAVSALRIRGVYVAVVTLAGAYAIEQFWFANSALGVGVNGSPVPEPHLFGLNLGTGASFRGLDGQFPSPILGICILPVVILLCLLVANMRRGTLGQRMLAVRSNERAAAAVGISVRNVKLTAFAIGSFIAGVAGAMYGYDYGSVSSNNFTALIGLGVITFAYVGGITMVSGAVLAALISTEALFPHALESWFGLSGTWLLLFGGVTLVFNLVFYPEGISGTTYAKRRAKKRMQEAGTSEPTTLQTLLARIRSSTAAGH